MMGTEISKGGGLLHRAEQLLADKTPSFAAWARRAGFKFAGILAPCTAGSGTFYYMAESSGLDARTMARSVSPAGFWEEKLSRAFEWQCFSSTFNELVPFEPLLGDMKDGISSLYFLPFKGGEHPYIFVTVELETDESFSTPPAAECVPLLRNITEFQHHEDKIIRKIDANLEEGFKTASAHLLILSLRNAIAKSIEGADLADGTVRAHLVDAITETARIIMTPLFRTPNCLHCGKDGEIKVALFSKDEQDDSLLAYHIARSLTGFLGKSAVESAIILPAGTCPTKKGTMDFLIKG